MLHTIPKRLKLAFIILFRHPHEALGETEEMLMEEREFYLSGRKFKLTPGMLPRVEIIKVATRAKVETRPDFHIDPDE